MSGGTKRKKAKASSSKPRGRVGEGQGDDDCNFHEEIDLASGRADAAADLTSGQVLDVVLHQEGDYETVVCRTRSPLIIVGTLANIVGLDKLIACLRDNHRYEARILSIRGAHCRVLIDRVSK